MFSLIQGINMKFRPHRRHDSAAIEALFVAVFTKSEGESEGTLIGNLSRELIAETGRRDLHGFVAVDGEQIVGAIFFSRLTFETDVNAFILGPVAIHNDYQGRGIGQAFIKHGLGALADEGVRLVVTYGDPGFYSRVGFRPISQDVVQAPFELSQPEGWLGQDLRGNPTEAISGKCSCVKALDNPAYW